MRTSNSIELGITCGQSIKSSKLLEDKQGLKFGGVINSIISHISSQFPLNVHDFWWQMIEHNTNTYSKKYKLKNMHLCEIYNNMCL